MTSLFSYLLTFLAIIFWAFRAIATLLYQLEFEFFATPLSDNLEILVLFATLPCLILVVKRNIIGAAAYLGIYGAYFGTALYNSLLEVQGAGLTIGNSANMIFVVVGIIIPLLTFLDILVNKNRGLGKGSKDTDWFYKNKEFDREFDERADRNQYRL